MVNSGMYGFLPLSGVGIALTAFEPMFSDFGCCMIQFGRVARIRQAIAEESMKYSSRSPTPCSWRLTTTRYCAGGYGNHNGTQLVYHWSVLFEYQVAPDLTSVFGRQDNYAPPPYSGQSTEICSQCGAARQDLS
ncbi:unnamed protein product, partial [Rotaria sp. Silwood1]